MGLIETEETNQFTFEPFAAHRFYTEINRALVQQALAHLTGLPHEQPLTIVDMACGTGAVTRLIAEELTQLGRQARLIGVDPSAEALRRARKSMEPLGIQAEFVQGESEDLPRIVHDADMAFFCNAIHLVSDKLTAFRQIAAILRPGGIFACNSAFYEGTYVPGTERFYRMWTRRAVGWLRKTHPDIRPSRETKAQAMQWLSPEEYAALFREGGFSRVEMTQSQVSIPLDAWKDLGQYWLFIEGALPGVPLPIGAQALAVAVYEAGQELGLQEVPRMWLQMVAVKDA
ncbi:class I SAM-dependent methyltransferase [Thermogemmatispora sp.]|uniref:class I SAM-dependent methyltransferase n=1 Tax=Thermogemmatispora sp. TaxID=1968838 RepID=UPI001D667093|nr:class I SAM-dependent methyltransferase [Thermogemmatispora sp.]MBX5449414.1 class I SAM-dependent methyltransferase [Thermogemmatispora sp.]